MQMTYDRAPVQLGSLHTSLWVPVLLGTLYGIVGTLYGVLDTLGLRHGERRAVLGSAWLQRWAADSTAPAVRRASAPHALLVLGAVALLHQISTVLYAGGEGKVHLC